MASLLFSRMKRVKQTGWQTGPFTSLGQYLVGPVNSREYLLVRWLLHDPVRGRRSRKGAAQGGAAGGDGREEGIVESQ